MISIIIPACNEERYIKETLKAIPNEYEKIVVCNGCIDNTAKIAKKYAKVIEIKQRNVSLARNVGAEKAKNPILIFLDADTIITKEVLEKIKEIKPSLGTCKTKPDIKNLKYQFTSFFKNRFLWMGWSSGIIFCNKEIFDKIKFDENLKKGEDSDFIKKARKYSKFKVVGSVTNSMRRFEEWGVLGSSLYWIREKFKPSKNEYPIIR